MPTELKVKPQAKSHLWVHLLKEQADTREREWGAIRRYNLEGWEAIKRQWEQLRLQLRLRREAWRKENEKLLEVLMTEPSTARLRKKMALSFKGVPPGDARDEKAKNKPPDAVS